ncbi:MAG TPA: hypothetical protein VFA09_16415 [Ktedonobacteraceae bacterium]|jgi:hypothetical protein|nr:hypothetical protein [Ktedonobacteraceae bacterium]
MSYQRLMPPANPEQDEILRERRMARAQRRKQSRRARLILWGTIGSSIILLGLIGFIYWNIQWLLSHDAKYPAINGVPCESSMSVNYHIHVHLSIYVNGKNITIPKGIGIASDGSCFYWLHTHTSDGIIHVEAPQQASNQKLDDFMTIWHDGFANLGFPSVLTQQTGWKVYIAGKPFTGVVTSPLNTEVPLTSHEVITFEYGSHNPPPDRYYAFPADLPT